MSNDDATIVGSKRVARPPGRRFDPAPAVRWLQPGELLRAATRQVVASTFGEYADRREMMAGLSTTDHDERSRRDDTGTLWLDFVADLGDGFDSTVSVAEVIAQDHIELGPEDRELIESSSDDTPSRAPTPDRLPRGGVLVMGGDQVYPSATKQAYMRRTVGPYEAALPELGDGDEDEMSLYAIPGNHDWYDGLSAFQKIFCTDQWIGAWKTKQTRSYFVVQLTETCWLWAIDVALGGHMDRPQVEYFRRQAKRMRAGDSIVLCIAKPGWEQTSGDGDELRDLIDWFQRRVVPADSRVAVMLSGDKHFYARRTAELASGDEQHLVIAGGGGAYLSSTRDLEPTVALDDPSTPRDERHPATYPLATAYPDAHEATRLAWRTAWARLLGTGPLVALIGVVYAILGALLRAGGEGDPSGLGGHLTSLLSPTPRLGATAGIGVAIGVGLYALARRGRASPRLATGLAAGHLIAHGVAVLAVATLVGWLVDVVGDPTGALATLLTVATGGAVGTLVFAGYLLGAQHLDVNLDELFSGMRHEGHKNFLRLAVRRDRIEIFAIGLDEVSPRSVRWTATGPKLEGRRARPRLIDHVVVPIGGPIRTLAHNGASSIPLPPIGWRHSRHGTAMASNGSW